MWLTYIVLTIGEGVLLWLFGMGGFDAVCHSMATISTGGFATHNDSVIGYTPAIQWIIMLFMLLSGINFTQLIYAFRGKPQRLFQDEETRWYICACFVAGLILMGGLLSVTHGHLSSIRIGFFTAVATITSTGFVAADYMIWPPILWVIVFFLMFTGGASGSTAGGMKWVRLAIFAKSAVAEIKRRIHPNAVIPVRFNGHTVSEQTTSNIMAFMFFYILIIVLATLMFCGCGVGFDVKLPETATDVCRLAILELLAATGAGNLHINTAFVEFDVFVAGGISGTPLKHELVFINHQNTIIRDKLGDGIALLLFLITVGLIVVATCENGYGGYAYQ
jgi:trk system potassium uptake protein TrkH